MSAVTEAMSDERLAEIRAAWADGGALNRTGQEVRALLAEVDRLRAALARVTDDSMAERIEQAMRDSWTDEDEHANAPAWVLAAIRAVAADEQEAPKIEPEQRLVDKRDPACVEKWPGCSSMEYDPRCCRFPKSCSAGSWGLGEQEAGQ